MQVIPCMFHWMYVQLHSYLFTTNPTGHFIAPLWTTVKTRFKEVEGSDKLFCKIGNFPHSNMTLFKSLIRYVLCSNLAASGKLPQRDICVVSMHRKWERAFAKVTESECKNKTNHKKTLPKRRRPSRRQVYLEARKFVILTCACFVSKGWTDFSLLTSMFYASSVPSWASTKRLIKRLLSPSLLVASSATFCS